MDSRRRSVINFDYMVSSVATRLIEDVSRLVKEIPDERQLTSRVSEKLGRALSDGLDLDPAFVRPDPENYAMYPLWIEDDSSFSIAVVVWDVGQTTSLHDHGMWGIVGIYAGMEHEKQFRRRIESTPAPLEVVSESYLAPGEISVCCTSNREIHQVSCHGTEPCVGLHIYGGDIGMVNRHKYDPDTGLESKFVSGWSALSA